MRPFVIAEVMVKKAWAQLVLNYSPLAQALGVDVDQGLSYLANRLGATIKDTIDDLAVPDQDKISFKRMLLLQFKLGMCNNDQERDQVLADNKKEVDGPDPLTGVSKN